MGAVIVSLVGEREGCSVGKMLPAQGDVISDQPRWVAVSFPRSVQHIDAGIHLDAWPPGQGLDDDGLSRLLHLKTGREAGAGRISCESTLITQQLSNRAKAGVCSETRRLAQSLDLDSQRRKARHYVWAGVLRLAGCAYHCVSST